MFWKKKKIIQLSILIVVSIFCIHHVIKNSLTLKKENIISEAQQVILLKRAEEENLARLSHIRNVCNSYHLGKFKSNDKVSNFPFKEPLPHYEIFYYDTKNKLSWCPIYKAGSTTWLYHFVTLGGFTEQDVKDSKFQINHFVREIFRPLEPMEAIEFLPKSLKFLIVRHPFERILSAYRDKLENLATRTEHGSPHYYKKFGSKIVAKYRLGGNNTNVRKLLKPGQYLWSDREVPPLGIEPTFKEFVKYLIDTNLSQKADDHWMPYYLYCTPCSIHFDVVGKVESMFNDQLLIIHKAGVHMLLKPKWKHKTNPFKVIDEDKMSEIAKIYFSQLNTTDITELYEKYKLDFKLFQYKPYEYINYVSKLQMNVYKGNT